MFIGLSMDNTSTQTVQIATPTSLHARDSPAFVETPHMDFNVFGYTFTTSAATSQSRHDRRPSAGSSLEFPPCYSESHHDIVPSYTASYEPATLAMYLFRFGFLFPPFWLMGTFILFSPLRAPPSAPSLDGEPTIGSWLPEKTEAEKEVFLSHMRKAELKWAKRCLVAFVVFAIIITIAAVLIFAR